MRASILAVEDDIDILNLLRFSFAKECWQFTGFAQGRQALNYVQTNRIDLVLLDIQLPDLSGFDVCRMLRSDQRTRDLPLIFLSARSSESDRALGLDMGADDYVVKPFSPRELVARIKAVLRRATLQPVPAEIVECGEVRLDTSTHEVTVRGKQTDLSALEFRLLQFLMSHPRRIFTRDQLLDRVWGRDRFVTPRSVDVNMVRLRAKVEPNPQNPRYLQTLRGSGYRFMPPA